MEPTVSAAFAQSGELGDIRSFQAIRSSAEQRRFVRPLRTQLAGEGNRSAVAVRSIRLA